MKTAGAALILISFTLLGAYLGERKKRGSREIAAFLALFRYARSQITTFGVPTKQIFCNFENEILKKCGFSDALARAGDGEIYFNAFTEAFDFVSGGLCIDDETKKLIRSFGDVIGKSESGEQIRRIDAITSKLEESAKSAEADAKKEAKIYITLGFSVGAVIFIMII